MEPRKKTDQEALDELFGVRPANGESLHNADPDKPKPNLPGGDELKELPIALLQDFATGSEKQPFRAYTPEQLESLKQDIIQNGIIQPLIVRPIGKDRFEIISGHNRRTAAREAGYIVVPCIVREMSDEEAILQMVSTNLQQRKKLLPSEKAFAYRMQLEAMKRQAGRPPKENGGQDDPNSFKGKSRDILAEQVEESGKQISRYVRLTYLIPPLLDAVDQEKLGLTIGEPLSFLSPKRQEAVENFCFQQHSLYISQDMADRLREAGEAGEDFTEETLEQLLHPAARNLRSVSLPMKKVQKYFPEGTPQTEIVRTVQQALKLYFEQK